MLGFKFKLSWLNPGELEALLTPPIYIEAQFGPVMISMPISGSVRETRGELMLGEELGLHRSNRLPWKRIFLESCLRVSQMELTSSWQSASAVRAHVWKASQWLWQTKDHQINAASAISLRVHPGYSMRTCTGCRGLIYLPIIQHSDGYAGFK